MSNRRRAEKAWRFRDRETSGSQSLYSLFASLQGIFIGIFSFLYTFEDIIISKRLLIVIFILGALTMIILLFLSRWARGLDHQRANYFEITMMDKSKWPQEFKDNYQQIDEKWKADHRRYINWRVPLEWMAASCFFANLFIFFIIILR